MAGAECGLWIAAGYVVQCLALQGTTAAKGALLAALQVVVVPAVVVLFPALRPKAGKEPTMKDWVCAGAALAGVALLELQGLTAPVASDAVAALQPVFFGISYLRIAEAGRKYPSDDDALAMAAAARGLRSCTACSSAGTLGTRWLPASGLGRSGMHCDGLSS